MGALWGLKDNKKQAPERSPEPHNTVSWGPNTALGGLGVAVGVRLEALNLVPAALQENEGNNNLGHPPSKPKTRQLNLRQQCSPSTLAGLPKAFPKKAH